MQNTLEDGDWESLLERIQNGKCTPFLGTGINDGILDIGSKIAQEMAENYGYPLEDSSDLARVTQFLAIKRDPMFPKERLLRLLKEQFEQWQKTVTLPDFFKTPDEPLGVLAALPFPIYMTTNYDDLMFKALKAQPKDAKREICCWNKYVREILKEKSSAFDSADGFVPTPANPVVYHLHGHDNVPESLVLTEDDYLDFLVNVFKEQNLLPPRIQQAITGASLLFIGYRLADWDFRVLFRGLVNSMEGSLRRISVAVQLPLEDLEKQRYWNDYFKNMNIKVYWGTAKQFAKELRERWEKFTR